MFRFCELAIVVCVADIFKCLFLKLKVSGKLHSAFYKKKLQNSTNLALVEKAHVTNVWNRKWLFALWLLQATEGGREM